MDEGESGLKGRNLAVVSTAVEYGRRTKHNRVSSLYNYSHFERQGGLYVAGDRLNAKQDKKKLDAKGLVQTKERSSTYQVWSGLILDRIPTGSRVGYSKRRASLTVAQKLF